MKHREAASPSRRPAPRTGYPAAGAGRSAHASAHAGRFRTTAPRGGRFRDASTASAARTRTARTTRAARSHARPQVRRKRSGASSFIKLILILVVLVGIGAFAAPRISSLLAGDTVEHVPAGQRVTLKIPQGSSSSAIARILQQKHVVENQADYLAAVKKLNAESKLQPGSYAFTTGQDPIKVVRQLMAGPNLYENKVTIAEGLTVAQTAAAVEKALGISADDFKAQAKASTYAEDYPFLANAYNDSLEGYLFPKTYTFEKKPTADQVIRAMLDQFKSETASLTLANGAHGLTSQQLISMASLVERESAVAAERPKIASVIYNRLNNNMALQIDAAIVYARGGGNSLVTYKELQIDSPYNTYKHTGLTPGPICSPSLSSIKAVLSPAQTNYLYYVASPKKDGTHNFSSTVEQFEKDRDAYNKGQQQ